MILQQCFSLYSRLLQGYHKQIQSYSFFQLWVQGSLMDSTSTTKVNDIKTMFSFDASKSYQGPCLTYQLGPPTPHIIFYPIYRIENELRQYLWEYLGAVCFCKLKGQKLQICHKFNYYIYSYASFIYDIYLVYYLFWNRYQVYYLICHNYQLYFLLCHKYQLYYLFCHKYQLYYLFFHKYQLYYLFWQKFQLYNKCQQHYNVTSINYLTVFSQVSTILSNKSQVSTIMYKGPFRHNIIS